MTKKFLVIVGPSASGKTELMNRLTRDSDLYRNVISTTTRPKRENEVDGVDYHFVNISTFDQRMQNNEFVETGRAYSSWYGTEYTSLFPNNDHRIPVMVLEPEGAETIRNKLKNHFGITVYLTASRETRVARIIERFCEGTSTLEQTSKRISQTCLELDSWEDAVNAHIKIESENESDLTDGIESINQLLTLDSQPQLELERRNKNKEGNAISKRLTQECQSILETIKLDKLKTGMGLKMFIANIDTLIQNIKTSEHSEICPSNS
ncbi:hypothetical protein [Photobacterium leiognathi]|uniref:hypothetical protein n=1 Tax=Photobacterium leiognathi TaxID=553611 RepID=UPI00298268C6|nr:hypothetical protein [Photobacterium leiognathi]